jgi:hypothetical protein
MHLILYAKTKESDLGAGHFNCILEYGGRPALFRYSLTYW